MLDKFFEPEPKNKPRNRLGGYRCHKCQQVYPRMEEFFYKNKNTVDGLSYWCKNCIRDYRYNYIKNPDRKRRKRKNV